MIQDELQRNSPRKLIIINVFMKSKYEQKFGNNTPRRNLFKRQVQTPSSHLSLNSFTIQQPSSRKKLAASPIYLKQQCLQLQSQCDILQSQLQATQQEYDEELEALTTLRLQNGVLIKRKKRIVKRLDEMENGLEAMKNEHKELVGEILNEINRQSQRTSDKSDGSKLQDLQDGLEEFKEKILQEQERERVKFMEGIKRLEAIQEERKQLKRQVDAIYRMQALMAQSESNHFKLPTILESQSSSFGEQAKSRMRALLE